jgi:hypothetical protein
MRWRTLATAIAAILALGAILWLGFGSPPIAVLAWTDDQRAIQSYSIDAAALKEVQAHLVTTWQGALNETDPEPFQEHLADHVLPAMTAYVTRLETLPTQTMAIAAIHGPYAAAWRRTLTTFEASLLDPSATSGDALLDPLITELTRAVEAGTLYRTALEDLCAEHEITLTDTLSAPPISSGEPAP